MFYQMRLKKLDQYKMYIKFNMKNSRYESYKIKYLANKKLYSLFQKKKIRFEKTIEIKFDLKIALIF